MMRWSMLVGLVAASPLYGQGSSALDTLAMVRADRLMSAACATDHEVTWGREVCGPFLLTTWGGRAVLASHPDSAGHFTPIGRWWSGALGPGQFPANSAIEIGGTRYSMVVLPLSDDDAIAATLLLHEQFHRIQHDLALPMTGPENPHLDEEVPRTLLRLEWRALARAVATSGERSCGHVRDALAFREERHRAAPGIAKTEALLERHEGLAEYTGHRLARGSHPGGDQRLIDYLGQAEHWKSYVRSFAYATGAAYGALLDRADATWRGRLAEGKAPAQMLSERLRCADRGESVEQRATRYGGNALRLAERQRADSLRQIRDDYTARLVNGPVLVAPEGALRFSFDPNTVMPLPGQGNVYPTGSFSGAWGSLEVTAGGALVSVDFQQVRVPLGGRDRDWKLTLAEGWQISADGRTIVQR